MELAPSAIAVAVAVAATLVPPLLPLLPAALRALLGAISNSSLLRPGAMESCHRPVWQGCVRAVAHQGAMKRESASERGGEENGRKVALHLQGRGLLCPIPPAAWQPIVGKQPPTASHYCSTNLVPP